MVSILSAFFNNTNTQIINEKKNILNEKIRSLNEQIENIYNPQPKILPWKYLLKAITINSFPYPIFDTKTMKCIVPQFKEFVLISDNQLDFEELNLKLINDTNEKFKLIEIIEEHKLNNFETQMWAEDLVSDNYTKTDEIEKEKYKYKYGISNIDEVQKKKLNQLNNEKQRLETLYHFNY